MSSPSSSPKSIILLSNGAAASAKPSTNRPSLASPAPIANNNNKKKNTTSWLTALPRRSRRVWIALLITLAALLTLDGSMRALESVSYSAYADWNTLPTLDGVWNTTTRSMATDWQRKMRWNYNTSEQQEEETKQQKHAPLNIVLFYADDWTMKTLGLVNPHVHTPNIDGMAKRGMFFSKNSVTTSICWQSRANMMTGVTSSVHQALRIQDRTLFNETIPWLETLYPLLRKHGHHVAYLGKYHNAYDSNAFESAFDWFKFYFGNHWVDKDRHVTQQNAQDALWYLKSHRPRNQSFALTISFFATHAQDGKPFEEQYMPQPHTEALYQNVTIPLPPTATDQHWHDMPWFFTDYNEARNRWRLRYDTDDRYQYTIQRLYRMAAEVDQVVGQVIDELKEQGVYNNTLLVFTTDNGMFQGEHGLADKWYPHEESIRVPLIIEDPRMPKELRGTVNEELTLSIDLAPTLLAAAGVAAPNFMQGRDIAQLYLNKVEATKTWRQDFFYEWNQGTAHNASGHDAMFWIPAVFALIQKDYKYFYWPESQYEQLFRITDDPFEEFDIYNQTVATNPALVVSIKKRYEFLKFISQRGLPV